MQQARFWVPLIQWACSGALAALRMGWGVVTGEWKGVSKKAKNTIIAGIAVIVLSIMLVGYGNSLK